MSHPYKKFENTPLWAVINNGIDDLVENNDIEESTQRDYIVGYLCKLISELETENK
ncbi:hypothetical protein MKX53_13670 [Psychrobacillus sp. FSL K6-4615]|uniref:hypothetical protein n=1 Tax=Bacillaceae TaxID=186817 RepID=UPI000B003F26|nr:hypothetical protein [Bacillus sp. FJAT-22090]